ncbi:MAG: GNAT family N-acetyltransferase [Terriglobia bacterium]|jgi:N-acetylglutamate synthase-like GNAT family acetyltransferase|nr:GNAT family N-acetyltransferase [Terriglobia bacterium]
MSATNPQFILRAAHAGDIPALHELIACSVHGLMTSAYTERQLQAALGTWLGVDSRLVEDGTYFIVEAIDNGTRIPVACGGWSKRNTPYGSDHRPGRDDALLDPAVDAARIRAFFVHPNWARRGLGAMILRHCERVALDAGFRRCEMGATLSGVPFYRSHGYHSAEQIDLPLPSGDTLPILKMTKELACTGSDRK